MTEYLVLANGTWFICRAAVVKAPDTQDGPQGPTIPGRPTLAWAERDGAVVCFAGDEVDVRELPEV